MMVLSMMFCATFVHEPHSLPKGISCFSSRKDPTPWLRTASLMSLSVMPLHKHTYMTTSSNFGYWI